MVNDPAIIIVLVNYFSDKQVIDFVKSELNKQSFRSFSIYLVNNGSNDLNGLKAFCNENQQVTLIDINKNVGYLGAFNLALDSHLRQFSTPSLAILSNTDLSIPDKDFFQRLYSVYQSFKAGIIGPSIVSTRTHHDQNPLYAAPITISKMKKLEVIFSSYLLYFLYQSAAIIKNFIRSFLEGSSTGKGGEVYAVHGSFMIFTRKFIEAAKQKINDPPFLFGEEVYLAEISKSLELTTIYDPSFKLYHNEHQTTGTFKSAKTLRMMRDSIRHWLKMKEIKNSGK